MPAGWPGGASGVTGSVLMMCRARAAVPARRRGERRPGKRADGLPESELRGRAVCLAAAGARLRMPIGTRARLRSSPEPGRVMRSHRRGGFSSEAAIAFQGEVAGALAAGLRVADVWLLRGRHARGGRLHRLRAPGAAMAGAGRRGRRAAGAPGRQAGLMPGGCQNAREGFSCTCPGVCRAELGAGRSQSWRWSAVCVSVLRGKQGCVSERDVALVWD